MLVWLILGSLIGVFATFPALAKMPYDPADIRTMVPPHAEIPQDIAVPQEGHSMESIGTDWARRQIHLMSRGGDDKFLSDANHQLERWFSTEPSPERLNIENRNPAAASRTEDRSWYQPSSVKMGRLGQIEFGFQGETRLSCDVTGEVNLTRSLYPNVDLRLHHLDSENSLQLQFPW